MPVGAPPIQIQKKKGMGCFGCGCTIAIVLVLLLIVLGVVGGRFAYNAVQGYTSESPATVATTDGGDAVYATAHQKVNDFGDAFEHVQPATLHLSGDEINTLIARDPAYAKLRGHLHVTLQDNQAVIDSSDLIGDLAQAAFGAGGAKWPFADRYLNARSTGTIGFDPTMHAISFNFTAVQANGQTVPPSACTGLNVDFNIFLNQALQQNQLARDFLARVHKADIENGELVIEIK